MVWSPFDHGLPDVLRSPSSGGGRREVGQLRGVANKQNGCIFGCIGGVFGPKITPKERGTFDCEPR